MDKNGMFGELLEQGQQVVQNNVKTAVSDVAGTVAGQIGIQNEKTMVSRKYKINNKFKLSLKINSRQKM